MIFAIMMLFLFTLSALFAVDTGFQQRKVTESVVGARVRNYYRAQSGMVDAFERIRRNQVPPGSSGGDFTDPDWPPSPVVYYIDLDTDTADAAQTAADDVFITISKVDATTDLRTVVCRSIGL